MIKKNIYQMSINAVCVILIKKLEVRLSECFQRRIFFFLPWEPDGLFTTLYILLFLSFSDDSIINSSAEEYSSGTFVESSLTETIIWSSLIILFCDDC